MAYPPLAIFESFPRGCAHSRQQFPSRKPKTDHLKSSSPVLPPLPESPHRRRFPWVQIDFPEAIDPADRVVAKVQRGGSPRRTAWLSNRNALNWLIAASIFSRTPYGKPVMMSAPDTVAASDTVNRLPFMNEPMPRAPLNISSRMGHRRRRTDPAVSSNPIETQKNGYWWAKFVVPSSGSMIHFASPPLRTRRTRIPPQEWHL